MLFILAACEPPGTAGKSASAAKQAPVVTLSFESPTVRKSKMWVFTNGNADQKYTNTLLNNGRAVTADAGAVYSITEKPDGITNEITVDPSTGEVSFGRRLYNKMTPDDPAQPAVGPQTVTVQAALSGKTASYTFTVTDHFSPRESHGSVVLGDDIYVIGGRLRAVAAGASDGLQSDEVWRSGDGGLTWDQVAEGPRFAGRIAHGLAVLDDNIYVIAGFGGSTESDQRNDVWKSEDKGKTWIETASTVDFSMDSLFASAVLNDKILLMGGSTPSGSTNEVWESSDGVSWTHVNVDAADGAKFPGRRDHSSAAVKNAAGAAIYVIGGNNGREGDVWRSDDMGLTWSQVTVDTPSFGVRSGHSSVVLGDAVYVIGGNSRGLSSDVWKSTNGGRTWVNVHKN